MKVNETLLNLTFSNYSRRRQQPRHLSELRSEVDRDAFLFPVAKAHRLRPFAAAKFGGQAEGRGGAAAGFSLGQGAPGFGGQSGGVVWHRAFLGKAAPFI